MHSNGTPWQRSSETRLASPPTYRTAPTPKVLGAGNPHRPQHRPISCQHRPSEALGDFDRTTKRPDGDVPLCVGGPNTMIMLQHGLISPSRQVHSTHVCINSLLHTYSAMGASSNNSLGSSSPDLVDPDSNSIRNPTNVGRNKRDFVEVCADFAEVTNSQSVEPSPPSLSNSSSANSSNSHQTWSKPDQIWSSRIWSNLAQSRPSSAKFGRHHPWVSPGESGRTLQARHSVSRLFARTRVLKAAIWTMFRFGGPDSGR